MSDPESSGSSCEDEETFNMTDGSDGGSEESSQDDQLTDLPAAPVQTFSDSSVGSEEYVVYGTTPPRSSRLEKMANKTHKHRAIKKMSPGPAALRPKSPKEHVKPPRITVLKPTNQIPPRRSSRDKSSPTQQSSSDTDSKSKKKRKQLRKQERDSKSSLHNERLIPSPKPLLHKAMSIDVTDYTPPPRINVVSGSIDDMSASLQSRQLSGLMGDSLRPRRIQSDFSLTIQGVDERQYCPPERKQFYRNFVKALKHSGISNVARPLVETPDRNVMHMARMRSENLSLDNPFGDVWEQIWLELKAYLSDISPDGLKEQLFYKSNDINKVLGQVKDFRIATIDPTMSLNHAFFGVEDETESSDSYKQVGFSEPLLTSLTPVGSVDEADNGSLSSEEPETVLYSYKQFLSPLQLSAEQHVSQVLDAIESVESLFSNRRKMGDEYPEYRTLNFRRRLGALILWHKVTFNLANKLSALSTWLGVLVELREVCKEVSPVQTETEVEAETPDSIEIPGILKSSSSVGASGRESRARFSIASNEDSDDTCGEEFHMDHQISKSTSSTATLQRLFSNYQHMGSEVHGPYRDFVNRSLKKKGLTYLMKALLDYIVPVLDLAHYALHPPSEPSEQDTPTTNTRPEFHKFMDPVLLKSASISTPDPKPLVMLGRSTSTGPENWIQEFEIMNLPLFTTQYIQLVHVPLDVMHECVKLQLELKPPQEPSPHSVRQLVRECRETLEQAIEIRKFYRERMDYITKGNAEKLTQVESDIEDFEIDLKQLLEVYFDYIQSWAQVSSGNILEDEWRHVKNICIHIRGGEAEAGRRFCVMAAHLLESTEDVLETQMDECCRILHGGDIANSCRKFKELFVDMRERASKALGFAKMLRKDLEIAADFLILSSTPHLLETLQASDHVQVKLHDKKLDKMLFVAEQTSNDSKEIHQLLNVTFAPERPANVTFDESYLLLVNIDVASSQSAWNGETVEIEASSETISAISEMQISSVKMIVSNSNNLSKCRNSFLNAVGTVVRLTKEQTSSHENVAEMIVDLKMAACALGQSLMKTAPQVTEHLSIEDTTDDINKSYQATMHSCFNLGFEYVREVFRLLNDDMAYSELGEQALDYAQYWIRFVLEKCDRGRGTRPRWASTGLEFMTIACAPRILANLTPTKFESLKKLMERCVDHVVGEAPALTDKLARSSVRSRKSWRSKPKQSYNTRAYTPESPMLACTVREEPEIEAGVIRFVDETATSLFMGDDPMAAGLLYGIPPDMIPAPSPPVSTESIDSSLGVESPLLLSGDITSTPLSASAYNPIVTTPHSSGVERMNSAMSTSGFYTSTTSLTRSDSEAPTPRKSLSEKSEKIREAVKKLDSDREKKLRDAKVIGKFLNQRSMSHSSTKLGELMVSNFKWQRGRKLGEGGFGKVYECRNLTSGEMNAVKQISIQEKDSSTVEAILDEIKVFQTLRHENIVKFFGVERHHNCLYMFMEYCNEGTLWGIARQGLNEQMIRRYTRDILKAVYYLHDKGVVHRDIKGSNIFLSSNGSIKLGDFGLSVQLKDFHKTMPNEIKKPVGTPPYMSPEGILKGDMGRPMDIWSVGCVVVEMATGKLPWAEYDNQFSIIFQLGSGNSPPIPQAALSKEGHEFLSKCFKSKPHERWKAIQLLDDHFVKVDL